MEITSKLPEENHPQRTKNETKINVYANAVVSTNSSSALSTLSPTPFGPPTTLPPQLYEATGDREDVSGRVILRADGQVIGGPTVRKTPGVAWSDPEGLRPVGGEWQVYSDAKTGRARLKFTIILSFQKKRQLEMDGVVMSVDGGTERGGEVEPQLHILGGVVKRSGGAAELEAREGDFSMTKIPAGEGELIATVGSQRKRLW